MYLRRHLISIIAAGGLAATGLGVTTPAHVLAGTGASNSCADGGVGDADDVSIFTSPVTLGMQVGVPAVGFQPDPGSPYNVALCYSTSPATSSGPEATGGMVGMSFVPNPNNPTASVFCIPDSNVQGLTVTCNGSGQAAPSYTLNPGANGSTILFNIPITVCFGPCTPTGLQTTGLIVGGVAPVNTPGIAGAGFQVTSLSLYVNNMLVFGPAGTAAAAWVYNPSTVVAQMLTPFVGGPCIQRVCVPDGFVDTTGSPLVGFTLPGLGTMTVAIPPDCIYSNPSGQC